MRKWMGRMMLVAVGIWLGAVLLPSDWRVGMQRQALDATAGARERAALWAASKSDRVDARASLFVEFPGIVPAIQRGGAFGGAFSRAIATDIFNASDEGIADARKLSRIEAVAPNTWIIYMPLVNAVVFETSEGLVLVDAGMAAAGPAKRTLIVTDSLFSMDGTIAPLADLSEIAHRYAAMLMVDEAHATGVFGDRGSGLVEAAGCSDGVHIRVGTLSKAIGAAGGFVAGRASLTTWLSHAARAWVFSTAHPPGVAAAAARGIALVGEEPFRRQQLLHKAAEFRAMLASRSVSTTSDSATERSGQIVPVVVGEPHRAVTISAALAEAGYFVPAIRPPSVPEGGSLLRISLSWHHTEADLTSLAEAIGAML